MCTTSDILQQLIEKYKHSEFRYVNGQKTVEIQNAHFIVDNDYILEELNESNYDLSWYEQYYEPIVFSIEHGNQFNNLIETILKDNGTRQAVITMIAQDEYCHPFICTLGMQVFLNGDSLRYIVNMRSNDVERFPSDVAWHKKIAHHICDALNERYNNTRNITVGSIEWNAMSFHIYEKNFELLENRL